MFCMNTSGALKITCTPTHVHACMYTHTHTHTHTRFTGDWLPTLNLITLNSPEARIFWRMLQSPEVQPQLFNFTVQSNDPKSVMFLKLLRKKAEVVRRALKWGEIQILLLNFGSVL